MAELAAAAFATTTAGGYTVQTSATSGPVASTGDSIVSQVIDTGLRDIENKKIVTGVETLTTNFADVAAHLAYQVSHNGTEWSPTVDISTDVAGSTLNVVGVYVHQWDLSSVYAPYFRLVFNPLIGTENIGTSGTMKFFFAYK